MKARIGAGELEGVNWGGRGALWAVDHGAQEVSDRADDRVGALAIVRGDAKSVGECERG